MTETAALTDADRLALRTLAVILDDEMEGVLDDSDYGDDIFDAGLLCYVTGSGSQLTFDGQALIDAAVARGLAQRSTAFTLMLVRTTSILLPVLDRVTDAEAQGLLEWNRDQLWLSKTGIALLQDELEAAGAKEPQA